MRRVNSFQFLHQSSIFFPKIFKKVQRQTINKEFQTLSSSGKMEVGIKHTQQE